MGAVLLALASAVGYGGSDFWAGLAARRTSVIRVTVLAEAAALALLAVVLPWAGSHQPSLASLAWGAAGGIGGAGGALALYVGFRNAAFSVAAPVSAVGAAGFSVLAGLLLGEHPGALALTGIALALPAIVGVSVSQGGGDAGGAEESDGGNGGARPARPLRKGGRPPQGRTRGACSGVCSRAPASACCSSG